MTRTGQGPCGDLHSHKNHHETKSEVQLNVGLKNGNKHKTLANDKWGDLLRNLRGLPHGPDLSASDSPAVEEKPSGATFSLQR